jgi:hypothetical protein
MSGLAAYNLNLHWFELVGTNNIVVITIMVIWFVILL